MSRGDGVVATLAVSVAEAWPATVGDSCGQFFGTALKLANPPIAPTARALEIGCCEFDFLKTATAVWPEMAWTGIDWRQYGKGRPTSATVIKGDVMRQEFPAGAFDWIVSISAIEHIGLGHYSHDPKHEDGDCVALERCWQWLAPGGYLYFDVPYNPARYEVVRTSHRIYDDAAIEQRLAQGRAWTRVWSGVVGKTDTHRLIAPRPCGGGEDFDYIGFWWQKP